MSDNVSVPTGYGNVTRVSVNLTITNIIRVDRGNYLCSTDNGIGSDNENISITVHCKLFQVATCMRRSYIYLKFYFSCCRNHSTNSGFIDK